MRLTSENFSWQICQKYQIQDCISLTFTMHIDNFLYTSSSWPMLRNVAEAQRRPAFFRKSEIRKLCLTDGCWIYWMEKRDICNRKKTYRNNYVYTYNVKQPFRTTCKIIVGWIWNCDRAKQNMVCPKKHTGYRFGWDWLDFRSQWSLLLVSSEHRTAGSRQPINLAATASIMPPYAHQDPPIHGLRRQVKWPCSSSSTFSGFRSLKHPG